MSSCRGSIVPTFSESASLTVAKTLLGKEQQKVDNWGVRFPTLVDDVANCLKALIDIKHKDPSSALGIFHCSSPHRTSKYELAKTMAQILMQDSSRLIPNNDPPGGAPRPQNTQLACEATWEVLGKPIQFTSLDDGFRAALEPFKDQFPAEME